MEDFKTNCNTATLQHPKSKIPEKSVHTKRNYHTFEALNRRD